MHRTAKVLTQFWATKYHQTQEWQLLQKKPKQNPKKLPHKVTLYPSSGNVECTHMTARPLATLGELPQQSPCDPPYRPLQESTEQGSASSPHHSSRVTYWDQVR